VRRAAAFEFMSGNPDSAMRGVSRSGYRIGRGGSVDFLRHQQLQKFSPLPPRQELVGVGGPVLPI